jgi:hypothetical protein
MRTSITLLFFILFGTALAAQNIPGAGASTPKESMTVIDYFTVNCIDKSWDINWKALSEIDSCNYVLQYSTDQINWIEFEKVDGTAHTTGNYTYSAFLKRNSDTVHYFRLQYDYTSSAAMYKSPVMNICPEFVPDETTQPTFIIDYNTMEGSIQVGNCGSSNLKSTVMVYSSIGQLIYQNEMMLDINNGMVRIPLAPKSHEILIVNISNGSKSLSKKILIP